MENLDYSIVVPVFNSELTLEELYERLQKEFTQMAVTWEVIFVDDGSADDSWKVLKNIKESDPSHVKAIRLSKNFGQHNATFCGFSFARGKFVLTIDDDLQIPPEEIKKLISLQKEEDADIVYGTYKKKQHGYARNMGSKYARKSSGHILGRSNPETSFRLIDRQIIEEVLEHHQYFVYIDELLSWYTENISFALVEHRKRETSKSGYNVRKFWQLVSNVIIYYTNIPLRFMVYGGLITSLFFVVLIVYFVFAKIFFNVPVLGYTSLITAILFSTSLIMFCLGVIGEYLRRIYMVQNKKPPFSIKKIL